MNIMKSNIPLVVISLALYLILLTIFIIKNRKNQRGKKIAVYVFCVILILLMLFYDSFFKYIMILCAFLGTIAVQKEEKSDQS